MINYFYQCELTEKSLFPDENPDMTMLTYVSRPFLTHDALQESIIKDFSTRLSKRKGELEVTSIKEVSPYKLMNAADLEKRVTEDEDYKEYVDTWDGPTGPDARFTFVQGNHHNADSDTIDLEMPPKEFLARYTVQSFDDHFVYPNSQYSPAFTSVLQ